MKKLVKVKKVKCEGLMALIGKRVTLFCLNYIYTGDLVGVNSAYVRLENPAIVYETGSFSDKQWKDAQPLPHDWYVQTCCIESYGELK